MDIQKIKNPKFLKKLKINELEELSNDIRKYIIKSVSITGGHLSSNLGIVDLTIADKYTYADFNSALEEFSLRLIQLKRNQILSTGVMPDDEHILDKSEFAPFLTEWAIFTYCKLLSSQIFIPLETDDKDLEYAPFQTLAQYFISKGYSGIIYKSTVCEGGKNIVLFDKYMAHPKGNIFDEIVK